MVLFTILSSMNPPQSSPKKALTQRHCVNSCADPKAEGQQRQQQKRNVGRSKGEKRSTIILPRLMDSISMGLISCGFYYDSVVL